MKKGFKFPVFILLFAAALFITSCTDESFSDVTISEDETIDFRNPRAGTSYVYTMDNGTEENSVLAFVRNSDGTLGSYQSYTTGGAGTGGGLGSQGAIAEYGRFLLVVNPGSNEISVMQKSGQGSLTLVDVEPSGGQMPISVTVHGDLVYVVHAGGSGNIAGFDFSSQGNLTYIPGSSQPLSTSASGPAQVSFNPRGNLLVVTEKATNRITVYEVDSDGVAGAPTYFPSAGQTPFGFDWGIHGELIVSEAFGGAAGASTVSSYDLNLRGEIELIEGPVPTNQSAACWVILTNNGRYAYTTNTASGTTSGYSIKPNGELDLLDESGVAGTTGAGPIDADVNRSSKYLYTLNAGDDSISIFEVNNDGSLTYVDTTSGLPDGAAGLIAE